MSKFGKLGVKLAVVVSIAGIGLSSVGASAAGAATSAAARPAAASAPVSAAKANAPAVPPFYVQWDTRIPTIQACVEEAENLRSQGIISAWACVAGPGGFTLWVQLVGACTGSPLSSAARITTVVGRPATC